jgi:hypothetical protein
LRRLNKRIMSLPERGENVDTFFNLYEAGWIDGPVEG